MKVLIIDDSATSRNIIRDYVVQNGHEVVGEAANGAEGLSKYEELNPDVVILDIILPVMNGFECLKAIKDINPHAMVLMCSGISKTKEDIIHALKMGALDYVIKPSSVREMKKKLKKVEKELKKHMMD